MAVPPLQRVLARQPRNIEALGLLAGAEAVLLHDDQSRQLLKQADEIEPDSPVAYFEVAEQLAAMRQYPRSAAMYQIAVKRAPWWSAARNGLGLLYTQSGDEDSARTVLEAAHTLDPFNYSTTNYLRLLDMMDKFARSESAHFDRDLRCRSRTRSFRNISTIIWKAFIRSCAGNFILSRR